MAKNKKDRNTKEELARIFRSNPGKAFNASALTLMVPGENKGNINYHITTLAKGSGVERSLIVKDQFSGRGYWKLNPQYESMDDIRKRVTDHVEKSGRVIQGDKPFSPTEPSITSTIPSLPIEILYGKSIVERMKASDMFCEADIEFLQQRLPNIFRATNAQR